MPQPVWRNILVAVSNPAEKQQIAVRKAAQIASRCGAKLTLFHAYSMPYPLPSRIPADGRALLEVAAAERREELLQLARPLKAAGLKVATEVVWDFPAFEAIVRQAAKQRPDLLVAESRRHSRVGRWFLANTDWELIREVPCPVWFVKQPTLPKQPRFLMALDPTHARAKPARLDDRIAALTAGAVEHLNGKVALVHAEDVMQVLPKGFMAEVMIPGAAIKAAENQRRAAKRSLAATLQRYSLDPFAEVVRAGLPDETIVAAAKQTRADVVVLGAVSRSGLKRSFVGSTAEKVIDAVASDLLIVKPAGFRTNVPRRVPRLGRTTW